VTALRVTEKGFSTLLEASPRMKSKVLKALADRIAPMAV
jgi:hypothetical protein